MFSQSSGGSRPSAQALAAAYDTLTTVSRALSTYLSFTGADDKALADLVRDHTPAKGEPTGKLRDLDGPLAVEGTLRLTPQPGYELEGLVAPRRGAPPEIVSSLPFLGAPDATGRRPFSVVGTF